MVSVLGYRTTLAKMAAATALCAAFSACSDSGDGDGGAGGMMATGGSSGAGTGGTGGTSVDLSSDPGSGTCTGFTPCGGDVLGPWRIESLCMDVIEPRFQNCLTAKTTVAVTGSLTFNSDGSYIPRGTSTVETTLPASCGALCSDSCTAASDGSCVCATTMTINETPLGYAVEGNKLVMHPRADVTQTAYFCRQGEQILMRGYSTATVKYQYDLRR